MEALTVNSCSAPRSLISLEVYLIIMPVVFFNRGLAKTLAGDVAA
jgi:hypothetical protein